MASDPGTVRDVLTGATGANMSGSASLSDEIAKLAEQLQQLQAASQAATASIQASSRTTASGGSPGGASPGPSIGNTLLNVFGAGLGLSPLISGIVSMFSGSGDSSTPAPLTKFAMPPSIQIDGGVSEGGGPAFAVDNPRGGLPRAAPSGGQTLGQSAPTAQITVQVQAMDSQSFLDHSADIAMAVRQAMLESSVLNDVVREA
jgi:hypothetical protein